jgi:CTP-dependent riboflavin kinase
MEKETEPAIDNQFNDLTCFQQQIINQLTLCADNEQQIIITNAELAKKLDVSIPKLSIGLEKLEKIGKISRIPIFNKNVPGRLQRIITLN